MRIPTDFFLAVLLTTSATSSAYCQTKYSFETPEDFFAAATDWPAWRNTLERHQTQRETIQQCLLDKEACAPRLRGLRHVLMKGAELEPRKQIRLVNRYVNTQQYTDDRVGLTTGPGNEWETLTEFLQQGGDCEDFAVAKYFILREFGFDADDMRVVVGREPQRTTHHALLAVRFQNDVLLLENDNTVRQNGRQEMYNFVYALNENGIWDHENKD